MPKAVRVTGGGKEKGTRKASQPNLDSNHIQTQILHLRIHSRPQTVRMQIPQRMDTVQRRAQAETQAENPHGTGCTVARTYDGQFHSVPTMPHTYRCTSEGCGCTRGQSTRHTAHHRLPTAAHLVYPMGATPGAINKTHSVLPSNRLVPLVP